MRHLVLALLILFFQPNAQPAQLLNVTGIDSQRYALVIGNNDYIFINRLEKAANDAHAMGLALEKSGFHVKVLTNASRLKMNEAINQFVDDISAGGQGVFFFAGHGVQINNQNYLLPVEIRQPKREIDIADQGISLQSIQDKVADAKARFTLLIIDACRNNPLPRKSGRSFGGSMGLAQASSAEGQMVVFSAGANQEALDKLTYSDKNPNGVFTRELLPWVSTPGISIRNVIQEVRRTVYEKAMSVNHSQLPAVYDQALGDFYFAPIIEGARINEPNNRDAVPDTHSIVGNSDSIVRPSYRSDNPSFQYPDLANIYGVSGKLILRVQVMEDGSTGRILLKQSSGNGLLDRDAIRQIAVWKFNPARRNGTALPSWVDIPVEYKLPANPQRR